MLKLAAGFLVALSGFAAAAPTSEHAVTEAHPVVVGNPAASGMAKSRTIYLNRHGATLRPGANDSRANLSSLVNKQVTLAGWGTTEAKWQKTVECMQDMWSRFDVVVTDVEPPAGTNHIEALFGGHPSNIGMPSNVGGVAPMAVGCSVVENNIVFAFTQNLPDDPQRVCEVMTQEIGHAYGLDHALEPSDPMTYLAFAGKRQFKDAEVSCGESTSRACGIGGVVCWNKQNSVQILRARLGTAGQDNAAPELAVTSPEDREVVGPGFTVTVDASDNTAISEVTLFVDGTPVATASGAGPYVLESDPELASGTHSIRVEALDGNGNMSEQKLTITVQREDDELSQMPLNCATGGATPGALSGVLLALLAFRRRRVAHAV